VTRLCDWFGHILGTPPGDCSNNCLLYPENRVVDGLIGWEPRYQYKTISLRRLLLRLNRSFVTVQRAA
jgi:hypothetical protein